MSTEVAIATAPDEVVSGRWVWLVPIEIFGIECDHPAHQGEPEPFGYGLMDAVPAWSDCNRAVGHMFRVEDLPRTDPEKYCTRVWVPDSEMPKLVRDWRERPLDDPLPSLRVVPVIEDVVTG